MAPMAAGVASYATDFGALPPEINSGRMYVGPGPATMLAASAGWESLAAELNTAASGYQSVIMGLTDESWLGPASMSMAAAVTPYVSWMRATASRCEQAANQATAAAAAYETAYAMTVPPPLVVANRVQLMTLIATNFLGQNTPAIMATEAEYSEMWAQDATAMYNYAASSASASAFTTFTSPLQTTNPGGLAGQAGGNAQTTSAQLISAVPKVLQSLATPGSSSAVGTVAGVGSSGGGLGMDMYGLGLDFQGAGSIVGAEGAPGLGSLGAVSGLGSIAPVPGLNTGATASLGQATSLATLSVPPSWADTLSVATPAPILDANVMPGGWGAMPSSGTGPVSKLPLGAMVGRESEGAFQRIGFRSSMIPRSPVAG